MRLKIALSKIGQRNSTVKELDILIKGLYIMLNLLAGVLQSRIAPPCNGFLDRDHVPLA